MRLTDQDLNDCDRVTGIGDIRPQGLRIHLKHPRRLEIALRFAFRPPSSPAKQLHRTQYPLIQRKMSVGWKARSIGRCEKAYGMLRHTLPFFFARHRQTRKNLQIQQQTQRIPPRISLAIESAVCVLSLSQRTAIDAKLWQRRTPQKVSRIWGSFRSDMRETCGVEMGRIRPARPRQGCTCVTLERRQRQSEASSDILGRYVSLEIFQFTAFFPVFGCSWYDT